jgi:hypothetical protein
MIFDKYVQVSFRCANLPWIHRKIKSVEHHLPELSFRAAGLCVPLQGEGGGGDGEGSGRGVKRKIRILATYGLKDSHDKNTPIGT